MKWSRKRDSSSLKQMSVPGGGEHLFVHFHFTHCLISSKGMQFSFLTNRYYHDVMNGVVANTNIKVTCCPGNWEEFSQRWRRKMLQSGRLLNWGIFCILGSKDTFGHNTDRKLYNPWDNCRMQLSEEVDAWSRLQGVSTKNLNVWWNDFFRDHNKTILGPRFDAYNVLHDM